MYIILNQGYCSRGGLFRLFTGDPHFMRISLLQISLLQISLLQFFKTFQIYLANAKFGQCNFFPEPKVALGNDPLYGSYD